MEVPLRGVNFPADKVLRAFPSKVQVTFQVGLSHFRQINADDFHIYVSYEELLRLGSDKYTVKIKNLPKGGEPGTLQSGTSGFSDRASFS